MSLPDTDVAVIGAGTYGVSVALALHERGIETRLYGRPFTLWLSHTLPNFSLRSDAQASGLHGGDDRLSFRAWLSARMRASRSRRWMMRRIPGPMFRAYLRWVLQELPIPVIEDHVTSLAHDAKGFHLATEAGEEIRARRVVIATGIWNHRYLPRALGGLGTDRVVHGWEADRVAEIDEARVLVVGGGQSAAEACLLLSPRNRVTWVHRSPLELFNEPIGLPRPLYNGAHLLSTQLRRLPPGLRAAAGDQFTRPTIVPALKARLRRAPLRCVRADVADLGLAANGAVEAPVLGESYDRIVACTGYRVGLRTLPFLSDALQFVLATPSDQPDLDACFRTRVPGLHFVGGLAEYTHGAPQRFMFGSRAAAEGIVRGMTR